MLRERQACTFALSQRCHASALLALVLAGGLGGCVGDPVAQSVQGPVDPKERDCLLRAMYFESNRSSYEGMMAVGTVVMNRKDSGMFPSTVCGVVGQPGQFAAGALSRSVSLRESETAGRAADDIMAGKRHDNMKNVMYFHTAGLHFRYPNMHYRLVAGGNAFYERYLRHPQPTMLAAATPANLQPDAAPATQTAVAQSTLAYAATVPNEPPREGQQTVLTSMISGVLSDRPSQDQSVAASAGQPAAAAQPAWTLPNFTAPTASTAAASQGGQQTWATSFMAGAASTIDGSPVQSEPAATGAPVANTPEPSDAASASGKAEYIR